MKVSSVDELGALLERKETVTVRLKELGYGTNTMATTDIGASKEKKTLHWDYVMSEVCWLANDFQKERSRHMANAKKISRGVDTYQKNQEMKEIRKSKEELLALKRVASRVSRDVKKFWLKINQVIAFKQKGEADEARQQAMDKHLSFLVKQTERYTRMLAQNMTAGLGLQSKNPSQQSLIADDESTFQESINIRTSNHMKRKRSFSPTSSVGPSKRKDSSAKRIKWQDDDTTGGFEDSGLEEDGDSEFDGSQWDDQEEEEDETTLLEQEALERREAERQMGDAHKGADTSLAVVNQREQELKDLAAESEMPIEQLIALYKMNRSVDSDSNDNNSYDENDSKLEGNETLNTLKRRKITAPKTSSSREELEVSDGSEGDSDFNDSGEWAEQMDDETTLQEQEAKEQEEGANHKNREEELKALREESELPIEQLMKMYKGEMKNIDNEDDDDDHDIEHTEFPISTEKEEMKPIISSRTRSRVSLLDNVTEEPSGEHSERASEEASDSDFNDTEEEEEDETTLLEQEAIERQEAMQLMDGLSGETTLADSDDVMVKQREKELHDLAAEGEMPLEQLLKMYQNGSDTVSDTEKMDLDDDDANTDAKTKDNQVNYSRKVTSQLLVGRKRGHEAPEYSEEEEDEDSDFDESQWAAEEEEDETTFLEQEALEQQEAMKQSGDSASGGDVVARQREQELQDLAVEGDMPLDQLLAMYKNIDGGNRSDSGEENHLMERPMDIDGETPEIEHRWVSRGSDNSVEKDGDESVSDALKRLEDADLMARSIRVERPYILTKSLLLREYQHIGLNWLVSLHERRLNGILADEMGLGKTIQTIALLAYLAVFKGIWGPHLIVVPTSCLVNWETEFKKFCPVFKVLTYFGSVKTRKMLRNGWSKLNSFHVCITSYQLVVQDSAAFRRKVWYYMILDEAHNIKNFKSKRWQTLLNFNTQRRLLLTGTPLQNNLMELWSLMHFLMPHMFRSRKEFSYWFNNPLSGMVEGNRGINSGLISRLHSIMRPFLLRRLKRDVAKQLPGKFEHLIMCKLSKRQLHLYEEFMSRSTTRSSLTGGGYLGMMAVLMQLRKVCNHPDLFEPRPITSPFVMEPFVFPTSPLFVKALERGPLDCLSSYMLSFWDFNIDVLDREELACIKVSEAAFIAVDDVSLDFPMDLPFHTESYGKNPHGSPFQSFYNTLRSKLQEQHTARVQFNYNICDDRCTKSRLSINWRTIRACTVEPLFCQRVHKAKKDARAARSITSCWHELVKDVKRRANEAEEMIKQYVFVLPNTSGSTPQLLAKGLKNRNSWLFSALPVSTRSFIGTDMSENPVIQLKVQVEEAVKPFYPAFMRQKIFFPDRKLVQFDSGKLQTLATLLQTLKSGKHKCLIFTQMSKMLDILEIFLNLNDHTFVRLDGSTSIDKRQKLMDQFNSDPKLFCFILSTRSGGLGINLTGADSVIFYDTDWNPAMDAQAQDRAHRIGQTRDVHIYRLVSTGTVEENILIKARQKKHLDFLVMTEGKFSENSLFSAGGLKEMLLGDSDEEVKEGMEEGAPAAVPSKEVVAAMLAVEDEEDVAAMRGAEAEQAKELDEFSENAVIPTNSVEELDDEKEKDDAVASTALVPESAPTLEETELVEPAEGEIDTELLESWQQTHGSVGYQALVSALRPIERYAIRLRTEIDPFFSIFYLSDQARLEAIQGESQAEQLDIEQIEQEKEENERKAMEDGDLVAAKPMTVRDLKRLKSWFLSERSRRNAERRRRKLTGAAWVLVLDQGIPFWYNNDTGEASYRTPAVIQQQEMEAMAFERKYNALPVKVLLKIFSFLAPWPDRCNAALQCARWREAAQHDSFTKRVLAVETGARDPIKAASLRLAPNTYNSLENALADSLPGDTIVLGTGHHWEGNLELCHPVKLLSDVDENSRCVVELTGVFSLKPGAKGSVFFGFTVRRPRKIGEALPCVRLEGSVLKLFNCVVSNEGAEGAAVVDARDSTLFLCHSLLKKGKFGVDLLNSSIFTLFSKIKDNSESAIKLIESGEIHAEDSHISENGKYVLELPFNTKNSLATFSHCDLSGNLSGLFQQEGKISNNTPIPMVFTQLCTITNEKEQNPSSNGEIELQGYPWMNPQQLFFTIKLPKSITQQTTNFNGNSKQYAQKKVLGT